MKKDRVYYLGSENINLNELAEKYNVTPKKIQFALDSNFSISSTHLSDSEIIIEDKRKNLYPKNEWCDLKFYLNSISKRDRKLIELRYGLNGFRGDTFKEIGIKMGLSKQRVRQIIEERLGSFIKLSKTS